MPEPSPGCPSSLSPGVMLLPRVKPSWEWPRCSHCSWQALMGSVPVSMHWEGKKAVLEAVEEGSWRAAGAG